MSLIVSNRYKYIFFTYQRMQVCQFRMLIDQKIPSIEEFFLFQENYLKQKTIFIFQKNKTYFFHLIYHVINFRNN